jgi:Lrp/AsnC family leucine-responsive transcriptional regulator
MTQMELSSSLDSIDRRILQALQADGRVTYDDLAARVGLSPSATLRRVKRLEDSGVISGYVALVAPERVGLGLTAYINVRLEKNTESHKRSPMDAFSAAVQTWPEVVECAALTGEMDYLLRVVVQDMAHYSRFIMESLLKHPSVQDCKTSFVLQRLKGTTALPV